MLARTTQAEAASSASAITQEDLIWDAYNRLLLGPDVERLRKLMVRADLLRQALEVPGDVVECGVFKGTGLLCWLKLLEIYASGSARRVVGFDTFSAFGPTNADSEVTAVADYVAEARFEGVTTDKLLERVEAAGLRPETCELVAGDITRTAPAYVRERPGFRISLLHMDLDLGDPTLAALEALWPRVVRGGVVVFDEYAVPRWTESDGVDRFVERHGLRLRPVPHGRTPTAMLIKD